MARLNESTASAEPIEILKRRFVRQNREIARVNSIQSLRIRSLESEVSHLLSENVSLREQIITLTQDLERFEAAKTLHDGVYDVKTRLDSKLVELSGLITELGSLPRCYSKTIREKAGSTAERRPRESSSTKQVNDADLEPSLELETDGKLPVILEDKYYPRRTLSAQELQGLSNSNIDIPSSPELEDPPRSPKHSIECDEAPKESLMDVLDTSPAVDFTDEHLLPPNLETRRKKIGPFTINKDQTDAKSTSLLDARFTRKCGSKRKFSVEDEESFFESTPAEDDGFEFSRPVQSPVRLSLQNGHSPLKRKPEPTEETLSHVQPKRKVLEPKNMNVTTLSQRKPTITQHYDQYRSPAITGSNENSFPRQGKGGQNHSKNISPKKPSTPISDNDTGTNYDKQETKDGQPLHGVEPHESLATADLPNTRPSRRRGAVVSYAEPNLRDKMRRSTNELGPAVKGDKPRRSSSHTDPNREPHEPLRAKSSSTKKTRDSSIASEEHALVGDETPGEHSNPNPNTVPEIKRQSSARLDDSDGGKDAVEGGPQYLYVRSEKKLEGQIVDSISHRQNTAQDKHQLSTHNGSDTSMTMDRAASVTTRKSRRHSSSTKASGRSTTPRFSTSTLSVEGVCNDLGAAYSGSGSSINELSVYPTKADTFSVRDSEEYAHASSLISSAETTRGKRVAARRRSMML